MLRDSFIHTSRYGPKRNTRPKISQNDLDSTEIESSEVWPAAALRASANAGGAANQRGALLGALLGAAHGLAKLRQDPDTRALLDGLKKRDAIDLDIGRFLDATLAPDGSPGWLRAHKTRRPPGHRFHGLDMDCLDPNSKVK